MDTRASFAVGQIVVHDGGDRDLISLAEEPRNASRTIKFLRTMTFSTALPTLLSAVIPRAVVRQVVSESGKLNFTEALPSAPVFTSATQKAVSGKALRTLG